MSIILRSIGLSVIYVGLLACGSTTTDDDGVGDSHGSGESTTAPADSTASTTTPPGEASSSDGSSDGGEVSSGDPSAPGESSDGGSSGDDADTSGTTAGEVVWDEDFVWVADFLRANCASCHATGVNGNLLLPNPDIGNDEVRLALEGVVATTGLLLVEPGDRNASQTYLQITNEFGAQFEVEDTDRFGAWIDAGAPYLAR